MILELKNGRKGVHCSMEVSGGMFSGDEGGGERTLLFSVPVLMRLK